MQFLVSNSNYTIHMCSKNSLRSKWMLKRNITMCFYVCVCVCARTHAHTQWCLIFCDPMNCSPTRLLCPWNFPGKNTGVSCYFLLQGIFPIQELGLNQHLLCLPGWQADSLSLSHLSYCCPNKWPQDEWLKMIYIYYLAFMKVRIPKWVTITILKKTNIELLNPKGN